MRSNEDYMSHKDANKFSWTNFFLVTGLSFLVFDQLLKFLDEYDTKFFLKAGLAIMGVGVLFFLNGLTAKKKKTSKTDY
jgi:hypothetical protein